MPGLIVFLGTFPVIDGLVVYLDELPFRTVAEVAKKANDKDNDAITLSHKLGKYFKNKLNKMYRMLSFTIFPNPSGQPGVHDLWKCNKKQSEQSLNG